jgi:Flp pilus assembly protein TadG
MWRSLTSPTWVAIVSRRSRGQILVVSAFAMIVFIGLIGSGVDYGAFLVEKTQAQTATDSASLAAARALVAGTPPNATTAEAAARDYLRLHGYEAGVRSTDVSFAVSPSPGGGNDTVTVSLSRRRSTYFWRTLGIAEVTIGARASAQTGPGMVDVILSLDQTPSMDSSDMTQLRAAVTGFVDQLHPATTDPRSARVGITQFLGQRRDTGGDCRGSDSASRCWRDAHALLDLSNDRSRILQVVNGPSSGCPGLPTQPSTGLVPRFTPAASATTYGCPLKTTTDTGTYIKVGFDITFIASSWNLWSTSRGGRSDARKVLVVFTDGETEVTTPSTATANSLSVDAANTTKRGADGLAGSPPAFPDDVEIFVVALFGNHESPIADTIPPGCPGDVIPSTRASVDDMLIAASSSRSSTCDHYYPVASRSALSQTFRAVAAAMSRAHLTL